MNGWTDLCAQLSSDLKGLHVGVYSSGGAPYHHLALVSLWGATPHPIKAEAIKAGHLEHIDVLIFPGGGFQAMTGMLEPLGIDGAKKVREWVEAGGMYLGSCAGSFLPADVGEDYWQAHEEARALHMVNACLANSSDSIFEGLTSPGVGVLEAKVSQKDHWLSQGLSETLQIVHYNGPLFDLNTLSSSALSKPEGVLHPTSVTDKFTPSEGFMGLAPQETLVERCIQRNAFNGIVSSFGEGNVVLFGSHPEFGFDILQLGWKEAVKLIANALRYQAKKQKNKPLLKQISKPDFDAKQLLKESTDTLERIASQFQKLHKANAKAWLEGNVPSFFGLNAHEIWEQASQRAAEVALSTANLTATLSQHNDLNKLEAWLNKPANSNQDVGFMGLKQLLSTIEKQLELSLKQLHETPIKLEHAYDGFEVHPYQIAVSSYLSAAGLTAAAHLLSISIAKLSNHDDLIPLDFILAD